MIAKDQIIKIIQRRFKGLVVNQNWGETGLFYNPENKLKKVIYLLTFKEKDGDNDRYPKFKTLPLYKLSI